METADIIRVLQEALEEAQRGRDGIAVQREEALSDFDKRLELADTEIQGLQLAIARISGPAPVEVKPAIDWLSLPRTEAVIKMMDIAAREIGPSELASMLNEVGREETSVNVSQTLKYLRKKKNAPVENRGRNRWARLYGNGQSGGAPTRGAPDDPRKEAHDGTALTE